MKKTCPPHTTFHKLPWKEKVEDEPCHVHKNWARQLFHELHCWTFRCKHRNWQKQRKKVID